MLSYQGTIRKLCIGPIGELLIANVIVGKMTEFDAIELARLIAKTMTCNELNPTAR